MRKFFFSLMFMLLSAMMPSLVEATAEDDAETVNIGIMNLQSADSVSETHLKNYLINYLNEIAKQTGCRFKLISGSRDECYTKLANGELQFVASVFPNAADSKDKLFTVGYTCYGLVSLWAKHDSPMSFDDPSTINGKTIGTLNEADMLEIFEHYANDNDWKINIKTFPTMAELIAALNSGAVDAVIDDGTNVTAAEKCVVPFAHVETKLMTDKANEALKERLDEAIINIETKNPFFETWLEQEFLDPSMQHIARFTTVEKNFIARSPNFNVAFLPAVMPFYDVGNSLSEPGGIYVELLKVMENVSGLKFNLKHVPSVGGIEGKLRSGEMDMTFAVYSPEMAGEAYFSNDIRKEDFSAIVRRRGNNERHNVAIPMLFVGIKDFFETRYQDKNIHQYNTVEDCLNAVESGKCDVAYVPNFYLMYENSLVMRPNLTTVEDDSVFVPVCLAVSAKSPMILQGVLNTSGLLITAEQKRNIIIKNSRAPFSVMYILSQYPLPAAMVLCILVFGGATVMFMTFRNRMQEKQNMMLRIKNIELQSALDAVESMRRDRDTYKSESETDKLTGLMNKVTMESLCAYRLSKFPAGLAAALFIVDLDHFKEANDTYGHQFGDEILTAFASSLRGIFRSTDIVARFGGDEFVVFIAVIPDPGIVERKAQHITQIARSIVINDQTAKITASVGIAISPEHGKTYDEIFRNADRALYQVKENGRNGYCVYQQNVVHK